MILFALIEMEHSCWRENGRHVPQFHCPSGHPPIRPFQNVRRIVRGEKKSTHFIIEWSYVFNSHLASWQKWKKKSKIQMDSFTMLDRHQWQYGSCVRTPTRFIASCKRRKTASHPRTQTLIPVNDLYLPCNKFTQLLCDNYRLQFHVRHLQQKLKLLMHNTSKRETKKKKTKHI